MAIVWMSNNNKRVENFEKVKAFLKGKKQENPNYKVLDAGGAANPWASEYIDAYLDIQGVSGKRVIVGDIQKPEIWHRVAEEKFDFIICSHTLEDIRNPDFVIGKIISSCNEGFISMPNKHMELSHIESLRYLGYCHHQYIFTIRDSKLIALRKFVLLCNFIKYRNYIPGMVFLTRAIGKLTGRSLLSHPHASKIPWVDNSINSHEFELAFFWKDGFEFEYLNGTDHIANINEYLDFVKISMKDGI